MVESLIENHVQLGASFLALLAVILYLWRRSTRLPPGPTGWPLIGSLPSLAPVPHHSLTALSKRYGPILCLRLGITRVVVACSASIAREFLKTNDANFSSRPQNAGSKHIAYNGHDLVWAEYGPRLRDLRKVCSVYLFSNKSLDDYRHVREAEIAVLASSLAAAAGAKLNLGEALNVCTANALGKVLIGKRVFASAGKDASEFRGMVLELMDLSGVFNIGDFVPWLEPFDLMGVAKKMKALHKRLDGFFQKIVEEHERDGRQGVILNVLLALKDNAAEDEGGKLTDGDIKGLLLDLFTAGTDTSASTVEWAVAELIRHPHILDKLQAEIDSVVGRHRLVKETDIPQLMYLRAIVKETFRLHPSTPLSLPRVAAEDCEVAGYHIPKGTNLLMNVWAIGRDPSTWPNPLEFKPDRFLPGSKQAQIDIRGTDFEVIPFGAGRRICAGMNMGIRMVQLLTATLAHGFDWELDQGEMPEQLNMEEAYGLTLQRAVPLNVHPKPRLSPQAYLG